jgi:hypothetical protein
MMVYKKHHRNQCFYKKYGDDKEKHTSAGEDKAIKCNFHITGQLMEIDGNQKTMLQNDFPGKCYWTWVLHMLFRSRVCPFEGATL